MKTKEKIFQKAVESIIFNKHLRPVAARQLDNYMFNKFSKDVGSASYEERLKRYQFYSAILNVAEKNLEKGYYSKTGTKKLIHSLSGGKLVTKAGDKIGKIQIDYKLKYGEYPPGFVVLAPSQRCNLQCTGCYAGSTNRTVSTLPYSVVDRIIGDVHDVFGRKFVVISGGEPFVYKSDGKTLLDIFEKYNDVFFLVYTNGTLITPSIAQRLSELGNVTPAISVEGYEQETDERRGKGVYNKIMKAMENLRKAGVPFGISVTATSKNYELLLTDEFYNHYFEEMGVSYMWQFQLMPIGRGKETFDLVVSPKKRLELYKIWIKVLTEKKYPVADFWNSGVISNGCIAYGGNCGYIYIDWNGNITPCVFVPYYVDNIYDLYKEGKNLAHATLSVFMKNGRKWQNYHEKTRKNHLMPCSIRDHYKNFRENIITDKTKPE
ncbi:MAG: radical SAM protein, partial [Bacteroidales bacterium]|nr:radical SAM protein [Bacteroidales bacterium]